MDTSRTSHIKEAQSTLATIQEISEILNTGLSPEALTICVRLCEVGVSPEVLASLVRELQQEVREYETIKKKQSSGSRNFIEGAIGIFLLFMIGFLIMQIMVVNK